MTYDPMDGSDVDEGVGAFARALEHINLGWAFAGACLRLPGIKHVAQLVLDASGLGPRYIPRRSHELPLPQYGAGNLPDFQPFFNPVAALAAAVRELYA